MIKTGSAELEAGCLTPGNTKFTQSSEVTIVVCNCRGILVTASIFPKIKEYKWSIKMKSKIKSKTALGLPRKKEGNRSRVQQISDRK